MSRYRYFLDLRSGSFIFCTKDDDDWPPEGYPVMEVSEESVKNYLLGDILYKEEDVNGIP